jgi:dienelactone hydrolase
MESIPQIPTCCLTSSPRTGTPTGQIGTLASLPCYISSCPPSTTQTPAKSPKLAILILHDLLGYQSPATRLLADSYSRLIPNSTVYIPDLFSGEQLDADAINAGRWGELDMVGFMSRNSRSIREPLVFDCANALREEMGYERIVAVGFCYGGWAALRLGSVRTPLTTLAKPMVDAVVIGHPSLVTNADIEGVVVPMLVLAVEHDPVFTIELKMFLVQNLMERGTDFDFMFFPGVEHGGLVRGDEGKTGERQAMCKARDATSCWIMRVGRLGSV